MSLDQETLVRLVAAAVSAVLMAQGFDITTQTGKLKQDNYESRRGEKAWRVRMEHKIAECVRRGE